LLSTTNRIGILVKAAVGVKLSSCQPINFLILFLASGVSLEKKRFKSFDMAIKQNIYRV